MSIYFKKRKIYRSELIEDFGKPDSRTAKELMDFLYGDYDNESDYVVVSRWYPIPKQTRLQRLNLLWVFPLYLLTVPYQWVFIGSVGVNQDSKIGKLLQKLIGGF